MNQSNKKTESVTFRCTAEKKKRMDAKANQLGITVSDFISDSLDDRLKRNTKRNKHKVRVLVESQEKLNQIIMGLDNDQSNTKRKLIELSEGMIDLWDF